MKSLVLFFITIFSIFIMTSCNTDTSTKINDLHKLTSPSTTTQSTSQSTPTQSTSQSTTTQSTSHNETSSTAQQNNRVVYISSYGCLYNETAKQFQFSFKFLDQDSNFIKANGTVKIRIENSEHEEVYSNTFYITDKSYAETRLGVTKAWCLINCSDITTSYASNSAGFLYFQIESENGLTWDEYSIDLSKGLPITKRIYSVGETWIVNNKWEFTINSVTTHYVCNDYSDYHDQNYPVILINYTYKNIGFDGKLEFYFGDFNVYNSSGEVALETLACIHAKDYKQCIINTKCTAEEAFVLEKNSKLDTVTIYVSQYDENYKEFSAEFKIDIENTDNISCKSHNFDKSGFCSKCNEIIVSMKFEAPSYSKKSDGLYIIVTNNTDSPIVLPSFIGLIDKGEPLYAPKMNEVTVKANETLKIPYTFYSESQYVSINNKCYAVINYKDTQYYVEYSNVGITTFYRGNVNGPA